jgi:hypothetical protein
LKTCKSLPDTPILGPPKLYDRTNRKVTRNLVERIRLQLTVPEDSVTVPRN